MGREFANRHILPSQTCLIHIDFPLHHNTVAHNLLSRVNKIARNKLIAIDLNKVGVTQNPNLDNFFSHILYFFVT